MAWVYQAFRNMFNSELPFCLALFRMARCLHRVRTHPLRYLRFLLFKSCSHLPEQSFRFEQEETEECYRFQPFEVTRSG
jgi:hypothetical protein